MANSAHCFAGMNCSAKSTSSFVWRRFAWGNFSAFSQGILNIALWLGPSTSLYFLLSDCVASRAYKALMRICDMVLRPKGEENAAVASQQQWWEPALCAFCCSPAVLLMENKWYNSFAMYAGTRAAQGLYNWAKLRSCWHFWGSSWAHGDSLLFAYSTAQIMCVS